MYKDLVEQAGLELKGKGMLYTSDNGHMFSSLNKDGQIGIRFSKEVQEKYIEELSTEQFLSYGAKMKGYILVPESMLTDDLDRVISLLKESQEYVLSLDPK